MQLLKCHFTMVYNISISIRQHQVHLSCPLGDVWQPLCANTACSILGILYLACFQHAHILSYVLADSWAPLPFRLLALLRVAITGGNAQEKLLCNCVHQLLLPPLQLQVVLLLLLVLLLLVLLLLLLLVLLLLTPPLRLRVLCASYTILLLC